MEERITNPGFVWNGGGWTLNPEGWEDDWDCVMDPWHSGGYAQWDCWYIDKTFSITQDVDFTNVDNLHLNLSHVTERNSGDDTYFRVYIDSTLIYDGPVYAGEEVYVDQDFPISFTGVHTLRFAGKGDVNSYVGCYLWGVSALAHDTPVVPVADFTGTPTSGETPLSVAFTDLSTNTPTSWLWNFGDGFLSAVQNPTHVYETAGVYTVVLKATNAGGFDVKTRTGYVTVTRGPNRIHPLWTMRIGPL